MNFKKYIYLKEKLEADDIKKALEELSNLTNSSDFGEEITIQKGRLSNIRKEHRSGAIDKNSYNLERNKIRSASLAILKDIKKHFISKEEEKYYFLRKKIEKVLLDTQDFYDKIKSRGKNGYNWTEELEKDIEEINNKWKTQNFTVSVIALMKSGKSTLLNSWIGNEYLPANVRPETMRIIKIQHDKNVNEGTLTKENRKIATGARKVKTKLQKLNQDVRKKDDIPSEDELILKVSLPAFKDKTFEGVQFQLLDTPGVNEAGVKSLEPKINMLVRSSDVIIYLLDLSKLKSEEEEKMFRKLRDERDDLFKQLKTRLFFVVNQIDKLEDRNFGEAKGFKSRNDVKRYITGYLKENLSINLKISDIFLVSAEEAVLGRVVFSGNANEKQKEDFMKRAYGKKRRQEVPDERMQMDAYEFITESGILELENEILNKIHSKRISIFVTSIIYKLEKVLEQVKRNIEVSKGAIKKKEIQIDKLKNDITEIEKELEDLSEITTEFKKKGDESIENFFTEFEDDIIFSIKYVFSNEKSAHRKNLLPDGIADFLNRTNYVITSGSKSEIDSMVDELHFKIITSLHSNFQKLWEKISTKIHLYHSEQSAKINKKIAPLVKAIEQKINEELDIDLIPNTIEVPTVMLDDFYNEMNCRVFELINKKTTIAPRFETEKRVAKRDFRFLFWTIRRRGDIYNVTKFKLFKDNYTFSSLAYQKYLIEQVESLSENTEYLAKKIVSDEFEKVKNQIERDVVRYSRRYISIIEDEIQNKKDGVDIDARKKEINKDFNVNGSLLKALKEIKEVHDVKY